MSVTILTEMQIRILISIYTYKVLTIPLIKIAKIGSDDKTIRDNLRRLSNDRLIHRREGGFIPGYGRQHSLYFLAPRGAEILSGILDSPGIRAARTVPTGQQHVRHWLGVVSCHIALRSWASANRMVVDWFRSEFEIGHDRLKATRLEYGGNIYTPDAVVQITPSDGIARLLVIEYYRDSINHAIKSLETRVLPSINTGIVERNFGHYELKRPARFLIIFETEDLVQMALRRWPDKEAQGWRRAFVKSLSHLDDFGSGWLGPMGERKHLLNLSPSRTA